MQYRTSKNNETWETTSLTSVKQQVCYQNDMSVHLSVSIYDITQIKQAHIYIHYFVPRLSFVCFRDIITCYSYQSWKLRSEITTQRP